MKYNVLGIEHRVGSFTATAGKDAGKEISYDFYRLHCIKKSRENIPREPTTGYRVCAE